MPVELFANAPSDTTALSTTIPLATTATATSFVVATGTAYLPTLGGFPVSVAGASQFRVKVGAEIMLVTAVNTGTQTWTVVRGQEGTTAAAQAAGVTATYVLSAAALASLVTGQVTPQQFGAVGDGVANDRQACLNALTALEAAGGGVLLLLSNLYNVTPGLPLAGFSSGIVGQGHALRTVDGKRMGSWLISTAQTGPVLDFTNIRYPDSFRGKIPFRDFAIDGDGVANPSKVNAGLKITGGVGGLHWRNIYVQRTGGPGFDFGSAQLSEFDLLTVLTPIGAKANDVPYFVGGQSCNGNRFRGLGARSMVTAADCGVTGAFVFSDKAGDTFGIEQNVFDGCWVEFLHVPTGGCLFHLRGGNYNYFDGFQVFDSGKETGAVNTAVVRISNPIAVPNYGGNRVRGVVAGGLDVGVQVQQGRNHIETVHGLSGVDVNLLAGAEFCCVEVAGRESGVGVGVQPVKDDSGQTNNMIVTRYMGSEVMGPANRRSWGPGTGAADAEVYREGVKALRTDSRMTFDQGVSLKLTGGTASDAAFPSVPPDGTMVIDNLNKKIAVRIAGVWVYTAALA